MFSPGPESLATNDGNGRLDGRPDGLWADLWADADGQIINPCASPFLEMKSVGSSHAQFRTTRLTFPNRRHPPLASYEPRIVPKVNVTSQ